ncbi:hypothetical protein KEJ17_01495 [Candidatus Bathyarchaeota archaeon]|nr:hypothetical protein [Candidatus Bathyarchaeota archaeon]
MNEQKLVEKDEKTGMIRDVVFIKTSRLHVVGLIVNIHGEELEIPIHKVKISGDNMVIPLINKKAIKTFIKSSGHTVLEPISIRIKVLPKARKLLEGGKTDRIEAVSTIMLDINDALLSKCPICMGKVESMEEFVFCQSCLTPYHKSCIDELLKSVPREKCWNCGNIDLSQISKLT